jgi:RNA-directed DNA polymerase
LSPLLANIALSTLDEHFARQWNQAMGTWHQRDRRRRQGLGSWKLVRYADDFVVLVNGQRHHAEALLDEVADVIAPLGLRLAMDKTRVVGIDEGLDFLGFHIRRMRKRGTNQHFVYTIPSKKAIKAVTTRISARTSRSTLHMDLDELLLGLNRSLQGWANYFRHGVSKRTFGKVDYHARRRIGTWLQRKHGRLAWKDVKRRFCDQGWRYAHNGVVFAGASSVKVTRYRYRGSNIPTPWTPKPAAANASG